MNHVEQLYREILCPQVRVRTTKAGGSGTILYSRSATDGTYHTFVLTCHHVIEGAIEVKAEWDSRFGRERKQEFRQVVTVEFFDWENVSHGHRPVNYSTDADVVAYDKRHDMALLKLRTIQPAKSVALLEKPGWERQLRVGSEVVACGCALLHDPILTQGLITHMGDEIDHATYWLSNANIIFGNSGGSMFSKSLMENGQEHYIFLGIPSRIDVIGWGTPITHLGYFSPITRVYEFFEEQLYHFLIPGHPHTELDCETERQVRDDEERRRLLVESRG